MSRLKTIIVSTHLFKRNALKSAQKWRRKGFKTVRVRTLGPHEFEVRVNGRLE